MSFTILLYPINLVLPFLLLTVPNNYYVTYYYATSSINAATIKIATASPASPISDDIA